MLDHLGRLLSLYATSLLGGGVVALTRGETLGLAIGSCSMIITVIGVSITLWRLRTVGTAAQAALSSATKLEGRMSDLECQIKADLE